MSLTARHLEENGIPTVVIGSALDIVTHCGVPRFLFTDLPLGNPLDHPDDREEQAMIVGLGLSLFDSAERPGITEHAPVRWSDSDDWRARYAEVNPDEIERLRAAGEARRIQRERLKAEGRQRDI